MLENSFTDAQIIERCREERENRSRGNSDDEFACLKLLRRAIVLWSPEAFEAVNEFYGRQFISWVVNHHRFEEFCSFVPYLTPEDVIQNAYLKLHRALVKQPDFHAKFKTVAYFMAYCKGAIGNCVNDQLPRKRKKSTQAPVEESKNLSEPDKTDISEPSARQDFAPSSIDDNDTVTDEDRNYWSGVDASIDWEQVTARIKQVLSEDQFEIFTHKIYGQPSTEKLLESGKTRDDIRKLWRAILAKLYADPELRRMLGR